MPPLIRYKPWTCPCGKRNDGAYSRCELCDYKNAKPKHVPVPRPKLTDQQVATIRGMLATKTVSTVAFVMGLKRHMVVHIQKKYGPIFDNPEVKVTK